VYVITDRTRLSSTKPNELSKFVNTALAAGVDIVQIRERDLPARSVLDVVRLACETASRTGSAVLVNDRIDVAEAAGAGVHLTTHSVRVRDVRRTFGNDLLIGASTHTLREAQEAAEGGADFIVFGPIYDTESKRQYGAPVGIDSLRTVVTAVKIPVLALGGLGLSNFREVLSCGAAGVAGISMFVGGNIGRTIASLKAYRAESS
jgi:thiamine-phosphate pyrophosphorylase